MLTVKNLSVCYDGKPVVDDVSFSLKRGDFLCVVGENGSGKTTLVKGILGLVKKNQGEIVLDGITKHEIGYLPQRSVLQKDFPANVFEIVLSGRLNSKKLIAFYTHNDKKIAMENLNRIGIADLKNKPYRELSGGQQQRVMIARALCAMRDMLIIDEPISGLDPMTTSSVYNLLNSLSSSGITILMVSHDIENSIKMANKILHMGIDKYFFGSTEDYVKTDLYTRIARSLTDV
jgi:zinc transport system ATP-binding protein